MANWSELKAAVASIVKTNGNKEITGQLLQNVLNNIISNVGLNSSFAGIATPGTNPGTPDGNVFYLAATAGTYSNFNGIVIEDGEAVILEWKGSWEKKDSGFATKEKLSELGEKIVLNLSKFVDSDLTASLEEGEFGYNTGTKLVYKKENGQMVAQPMTKDGLYRYNDTYYNWNGDKLVPFIYGFQGEFSTLSEALQSVKAADRIPNRIIRFYDTSLGMMRVLFYNYYGSNYEYISNFSDPSHWTELVTERLQKGGNAAIKSLFVIKGIAFPTKALISIDEDKNISYVTNDYSSISDIIPIPSDCKKVITFTAQTNETNRAVVFLDENKMAVSSFTATMDLIQREYSVPNTAKYVIFCCINNYVGNGAYYGFETKDDLFYIDFNVKPLKNELSNTYIDLQKKKNVSRNDFTIGGLTSAIDGSSTSSAQYNYNTGIKVIPNGATKITAMCSQWNKDASNCSIVLLDESFNVVLNCGTNSEINVLEFKEVDIPDSAVYYAINCSVAKVSEAFYNIHQPDVDSLLMTTNNDFNEGGYISDVDGLKKSSSIYNYTTGIKSITAVKNIRARVAQTTVTADHGAIIFFDKDKNVISSYKNKEAYKLETVNAVVPSNAAYYAINCEAKSIAEAWYELVVDKDKAINNITHLNELKVRNQVSVLQSSQPDIIIASHKGYRFGNNDKVYTWGSPYAYINASKLGYRWWEVDIQLTSDNHWVVVHDWPLGLHAGIYDKKNERLVTTEDNFIVNQFTLSEFRERFEWQDGGKIMTLLEVFRLANSCNCNIVLEFKSDFGTKEASDELKKYCQLFGIYRIVYNCTSTDYSSIFPKLINLGIYAAGSASMVSATKEKMLALFEFAKSVGNTVVGYYSSAETIEDEWMIEKSLEYGVSLQGKYSSILPYSVIVSDDMCRKLDSYSNEEEFEIEDVNYLEYTSVYQLNLEKPTNVCVTFMAEEGMKCKIGNFEIEESTIVSYVLNKGSYSLAIKGNGKINTLTLQW